MAIGLGKIIYDLTISGQGIEEYIIDMAEKLNKFRKEDKDGDTYVERSIHLIVTDSEFDVPNIELVLINNDTETIENRITVYVGYENNEWEMFAKTVELINHFWESNKRANSIHQGKVD